LASLVPAGGHLTNRQIDRDAAIGCLLTLIDLAGCTGHHGRDTDILARHFSAWLDARNTQL
jgi:hypothetical protein